MRDESDQACFKVQGIDSLEVKSDTHLNAYDSSSIDDNPMDAHALNEDVTPHPLYTCTVTYLDFGVYSFYLFLFYFLLFEYLLI